MDRTCEDCRVIDSYLRQWPDDPDLERIADQHAAVHAVRRVAEREEDRTVTALLEHEALEAELAVAWADAGHAPVFCGPGAVAQHCVDLRNELGRWPTANELVMLLANIAMWLYAAMRGWRPRTLVVAGVCHWMPPQCRSSRSR
jgi:hypothetical protein